MTNTAGLIACHSFTVVYGSDDHVATCACGTVVQGETEAEMYRNTFRHMEEMREAARLIETERELEAIRSTSTSVTNADPTTTCVNCSGEIHYSGHVDSASSHYAHTATGERVCATGTFNLGRPIPHCPQCHSVKDWDVNEHAWGISSNCAGCGYHSYYGIGD